MGINAEFPGELQVDRAALDRVRRGLHNLHLCITSSDLNRLGVDIIRGASGGGLTLGGVPVKILIGGRLDSKTFRVLSHFAFNFGKSSISPEHCWHT